MYARTSRRKGRFDEAMGMYRALLERFPQSRFRPSIIFGMALSWKGKGEKHKAIAGFEQYIREFPTADGVEDARREIAELKNPSPKS